MEEDRDLLDKQEADRLNSMWHCQVCGVELPVGGQYCAECSSFYEEEAKKERERRERNGIEPDAPLVTYYHPCSRCAPSECKGHTR